MVFVIECLFVFTYALTMVAVVFVVFYVLFLQSWFVEVMNCHSMNYLCQEISSLSLSLSLSVHACWGIGGGGTKQMDSVICSHSVCTWGVGMGGGVGVGGGGWDGMWGGGWGGGWGDCGWGVGMGCGVWGWGVGCEDGVWGGGSSMWRVYVCVESLSWDTHYSASCAELCVQQCIRSTALYVMYYIQYIFFEV